VVNAVVAEDFEAFIESDSEPDIQPVES